MNQKDGFDCPSCAWPDPDDRKHLEFCENGAKAVDLGGDPGTWSPRVSGPSTPSATCASQTEYWLGMQGRLTEPVYKAAGEDHYEPISWDEALRLVADKLKGWTRPTRRRSTRAAARANEAAFLYQLFVRALRHQQPAGLLEHVPRVHRLGHAPDHRHRQGDGHASTTSRKADLIIIMGQNPGTNHPRMLTALEEASATAARSSPSTRCPKPGCSGTRTRSSVSGVVGHGTQIADQFLQIRIGGDMALLQAVSKRVLDAEDRAPGTVLDHALPGRSTATGSTSSRSTSPGWTRHDVLEATGLTQRADRRARRPLPRAPSEVDHHLGDGPHPAQEGGRHHQGDRQPPAAARQHRQAGRRRLARSAGTATCRATARWASGRSRRPDFLDALEAEFGFPMPREHGHDVVEAIRAMRDGEVQVFFALGGNFVVRRLRHGRRPTTPCDVPS